MNESDEGVAYWSAWESSLEHAVLHMVRRLRQANIEVELPWARVTPYERELLDALHREGQLSLNDWIRRTGGRLIASKNEADEDSRRARMRYEALVKLVGDYGQRSRWVYFWLDEIAWSLERIAIIDDLLRVAPETLIPCWRGTPHAACLVRLDVRSHAAFVERLRRLDWKRAADGAAHRGYSIPYLGHDQRFNYRGQSYQAGHYGPCDLYLTLLDENGRPAGGSSTFHLVEAEIEAYDPKATSLPGGARNRKNLLRNLFG